MNIAKNLSGIKDNIARICGRIGVDPTIIELVAVSKRKPYSDVETAYDAGQRIFGENIAQELRDKALLNKREEIKWHYIGHLQTNKIKMVVPYAHLIHSIDRLKLAVSINEWLEKNQVHAPIEGLIQVRTAKEETKFGIEPDLFFEEIENWQTLSHVRFKGVMTMATNTDDENEIRRCFKEAKAFYLKIGAMDIPNMEMKWLSMGMTGDYEIALEEGANMLRIGSAIFGARQY